MKKMMAGWIGLSVLVVCAVAQDMSQEVYSLGQITVTPGADTRDVFANPKVEAPSLNIAISEVSRIDLERQHPRTLTDALEFAPGAHTETRGRKVKSFTSFRGQVYPYPDYAINGVWQREFLELPYFFPASQVERIEVIRSSAALLIGLSDIAGVINIVPKRYTETERFLDLGVGEYDTYRGDFFVGGTLENGGYTAGAGYLSTEGPTGLNAGERMTHAAATFDWQSGEHWEMQANAFAIYGNRELRRAVEPAGKRFRTGDEEYDPIQALMVSWHGLYRPASTLSSELTLSYTDRRGKYKSTTDGVTTEHDDDDYEFSAGFIQALAPAAGNTLRLGGHYNHWAAPDGKRFYAGRETDLHTISGVIVDEQELGDVMLDAGIRVDQTYIEEYGAFSIEGSGRAFKTVEHIEDEWDDPTYTAHAGAAWSVRDGVTIYSHLSSGIVTPRTGAVTEDGEDPADESRHTIDAGIELKSARLGRLTFGSFYTLRDDASDLTGGIATNAQNDIIELYDNVDLETYGLEFEARSAVLASHWTLFADGTLMDNRRKENGDYESNVKIPEVILNAGVYFQGGAFDANVFGKYVGGYENNRFSTDKQFVDLGDYVDINLNCGYRVGAERKTRLYVAVENILNDEYSTVLGYPDDGRLVSGGVQHSF